MMKPIVQLRPGNKVKTKRTLNDQIIKFWRYARENGNRRNTMLSGTILTITETNPGPGNSWVKLEIPGTHPPAFLKVSGQELAGQFDLV